MGIGGRLAKTCSLCVRFKQRKIEKKNPLDFSQLDKCTVLLRNRLQLPMASYSEWL
jgi:hypothetical protein